MSFSWLAMSRPLVAMLKHHGTLFSRPVLTEWFAKNSAGLLSLALASPTARMTCNTDHRINFALVSQFSPVAVACLGAGAACAYLTFPFSFKKDHPEQDTGPSNKSLQQHFFEYRSRLRCKSSRRVSCHCESLGQVVMSPKGIQKCGAGILVYVLNCSSSRRQNGGAAKAILKELDVNQDFYELRSREEITSTFPLQPGAIEKMLVSDRHVLLVGLRSTAFGGLPEECGNESGKTKFTSRHPELPGWVLSLRDTSADRKQRFAECLAQLANELDALHADIIDPNHEIAFHYNIGCVDAGGKWEEYNGMIQEFASTVATKYGEKYKVAIYGCPVNEL